MYAVADWLSSSVSQSVARGSWAVNDNQREWINTGGLCHKRELQLKQCLRCRALLQLSQIFLAANVYYAATTSIPQLQKQEAV